jgi:hypothetical protein
MHEDEFHETLEASNMVSAIGGITTVLAGSGPQMNIPKGRCFLVRELVLPRVVPPYTPKRWITKSSSRSWYRVSSPQFFSACSRTIRVKLERMHLVVTKDLGCQSRRRIGVVIKMKVTLQSSLFRMMVSMLLEG